MCLINYRKINLEKPLTVYKVFQVIRNGEIRSPYYPIEWQIGRLYEQLYAEPEMDDYEIKGHAYHCFLDEEEAKKAAEYLQSRNSQPETRTYVALKCTISPASQFVYKGEWVLYEHSMYGFRPFVSLAAEKIKIEPDQRKEVEKYIKLFDKKRLC